MGHMSDLLVKSYLDFLCSTLCNKMANIAPNKVVLVIFASEIALRGLEIVYPNRTRSGDDPCKISS